LRAADRARHGFRRIEATTAQNDEELTVARDVAADFFTPTGFGTRHE
jgi:hypothetical protein